MISANAAARAKMRQSADTVVSTPSRLAVMPGVSFAPTRQPSVSPSGMPATDSASACNLTMRRICRPVAPMVLSSP